jgi:hypothetical protein
VRDKLIALLGVGGIGGVANRQFQAQLWVEVGGLEVDIAEDFLFRVGVLVVDVDADLGLQIGRHLGAAAHDLAACVPAQMAPFQAQRGDVIQGESEQVSDGLALWGTGEILRNGLDLEQGHHSVGPCCIATKLGVIDVLIHFGGHFEHDEAGRVVAERASGAVVGGTQGTGETEVQGRADEIAETAVNITL